MYLKKYKNLTSIDIIPISGFPHSGRSGNGKRKEEGGKWGGGGGGGNR